MERRPRDKDHEIPMGSLVEMESGVRLFVVSRYWDCDGTPLYALSADRDDTRQESPSFLNRGWIGGHPEWGLKIIRPTATCKGWLYHDLGVIPPDCVKVTINEQGQVTYHRDDGK
jgi:hypothetical protein